jgi:predicted peptidase
MAAVASLLALAVAAPADAHGSRGHEPQIIDVTVITEVTPVGYKVTGLAIEYDRVISLGRAEIDEAAFAVQATLSRSGADALSGPRTVVDAYTNRDADFSERQRAGRYVVLELNAVDALALSAYNEGNFSRLYDLDGAYQVTQVGDIDTGHRRVIPARPDDAVTSTAVHNLIVDEYADGTFAASSGISLPYRYFAPEVRGRHKYPLVVTLHGYGESGNNNLSQIAGNQISVAFADPARQAEHPAFVLSPQADPTDPTKGGWWDTDMQVAVVELVEEFVATHPAVDPEQVYLTGLSMGSYGSWGLLPASRDLFAAALLVCGAGDEAAAVQSLGDLPIWAVHSVDDFLVAYDAPGSDYRIFKALEVAGHPVTWSEWSGLLPDAELEAAAAEARARAEAEGSIHVFTTLPEGTTPLFSHGAWIPTYTNDVIIDWLFDQGATSAHGGHPHR